MQVRLDKRSALSDIDLRLLYLNSSRAAAVILDLGYGVSILCESWEINGCVIDFHTSRCSRVSIMSAANRFNSPGYWDGG